MSIMDIAEDQLCEERQRVKRLEAACDLWISSCIEKDAQIERAKQNTGAAIKQVEELQSVLREIAAGEFDGESTDAFARRCRVVAKGAL